MAAEEKPIQLSLTRIIENKKSYKKASLDEGESFCIGLQCQGAGLVNNI